MIHWKYAVALAVLCLVYPRLNADVPEAKPAAPAEQTQDARTTPPGQYELFLIGPDGRKQHLQSMQAGPKDDFRSVVDSYKGERFVLGVIVGDDDSMADGLIVKNVSDDMPAARAGLLKGDRLLRLNESPLKHPTDLVKSVNDLKGEAVTLTVLRDGKELEIKVAPVMIKEEPIEQEPNAWLHELPPEALRKLLEMGFKPGPQFLGPGVVLDSSQVNSRECLEFKIKVRQLELQIQELEKKVQALSERLPAAPVTPAPAVEPAAR